MTKSKLAFKLLPAEIAIWLNSLERLNSVKIAIELNNAAKILRSYKADTNDVLKALIQLTPTILSTCNTIESSFLIDPQSKKYPIKVVKLCIQLLRNTGLAFSNTGEQSHDLYMALQFIGHAQRLASIIHETPSSSLWKETARVYNLALSSKTTQQAIDHKILDFKDQLSIEAVLKRNILFHLFTPYKYSSSQIKELFLIANTLADKLLLNNVNTPSSNVFYWDSDNNSSNNTPSTINHTIKHQQLNTTIDTKDVLTSIQSTHFICNLDNDILSILLIHLSGYKSIINKPIPSPPIISHLLTGFNNITEHLTKVSTLQKIEQLSTETAPKKTTGDMSIQTMDTQHDNLNFSPKIAYSSSYKEFLSKAKPVKTLQVSNEKYIIAETSYLECNIGEVAMLCHPNLTNTFGIIRQVKITNSSKTVHILIEKIAGIVSTQTTSPELIYIQNLNSHQLLFQSPCKLANGSKLKRASDELFTLTELTDYSTYFSLYQATLASTIAEKN